MIPDDDPKSPVSYAFPTPTLNSRLKRVESAVQRRRRGQVGAIVDLSNTRFRTVASSSVDQDGNVIVPKSSLSTTTVVTGSSTSSTLGEDDITGLVPDLAARELIANKDQPSGYAGLDGSGLLLTAEIPSLPYTASPVTAPTFSNDPGTAGQWAYDSGFIYVCVATDTWVRAALASW